MNFMGLMRKDAEELILKCIRATFSFEITYFLEHKRVGGFLNFCCLLGAQGSSKVQYCDPVRVIAKGLRRQEACTEGCSHLGTIAFPLQFRCSDHLDSLPNQNKQK